MSILNVLFVADGCLNSVYKVPERIIFGNSIFRFAMHFTVSLIQII